MKTASLCHNTNPTNANAQKLKKAHIEIINAYQKEEIEYINARSIKL